jgi:carbamoyl-phosphate synthase large subunit
MGLYNVLVLPGGTEIGLEIRRALRDCKEIRLYSAASDVSNHAPYVYSRHFIVPSVHEPNWLDALNNLIVEQNIHYVYPAHDDAVLAITENSHMIKAKIVSSPIKTCRIARSKLQTYKTLVDVVPVPRIYDNASTIAEYPVFIKPDIGQGSEDVHIVYSKEQLLRQLGTGKNYIITEYLPGDEYTVDCFSDRVRGLLFCGGRKRKRTRSGIAMSCPLAKDSLFHEYAEAISKKIEFHGAWFFQLKRDQNGVLKILEMAPRIAGTMALNRVRGINFPLLSIYEQERIPITIMENNVDVDIDRALVNRYRHSIQYGSVYVDLDDTLILNGSVNTNLIQFLYQCINEKIRLVLLTKHDGVVEHILQTHRLRQLFDDVFHIDKAACKADYIKEPDAILIDDSFSERKTANDKLGIMTFDCSMIEMLMNERS